MSWALVKNGDIAMVIREPRNFEYEGTQYSSTVFHTLSKEEREEIGLFPIETEQHPDTDQFVVYGSTLTFSVDKVIETYQTAPLPAPDKAVRIADIKARLLDAIDNHAGSIRAKYITVGIGQDMTYREKVDEVKAFNLDPDPQSANYQMLAAEIGVTGGTLAAVAAVITNKYNNWKTLGASIEKRRLTLKAQVTAATTLNQLRAIRNSLPDDWNA